MRSYLLLVLTFAFSSDAIADDEIVGHGSAAIRTAVALNNAIAAFDLGYGHIVLQLRTESTHHSDQCPEFFEQSNHGAWWRQNYPRW